MENLRFNQIIDSMIIIDKVNIDINILNSSKPERELKISHIITVISNLFTSKINEIIDKTERKTRIFIDFHEDLSDFLIENNKKTEKFNFFIEFFDCLIGFLYEIISKIRFIDNKDVVILCPRLFIYKKYDIEKEKFLSLLESNSELILHEKYKNSLFIKRFTLDDINPSNILSISEIDHDLYEKYFFFFFNCSTFTSNRYNNIIFGGSFDHFHLGHRIFLNKACFSSYEKLYFGLTTMEMLSKKTKECVLQPYNYRKEKVISFLTETYFLSEHNQNQVIVYEINSREQGSIVKDQLDALIITKETEEGAEIVNKKRVFEGKPELKLIFSNILGGNHDNSEYKNKLSSSEIRKGMTSLTLSMDIIGYLYSQFEKLLLSVNSLIPKEFIQFYFTIIRDKYSEGWRKYHSLVHINDFIEKFDYCLSNSDLSSYLDEVNTKFSIFYHDIVYTPSRTDNEERSVDEFLRIYDSILENNYNKEGRLSKEKVVEYILATKYHFDDRKYDDFNLNLFLDIDLSSMAGDDYMTIREGIMYEYSHHLSEKELFEGRIQFMKGVLERTLFRTPVFSHLEGKTKENNRQVIRRDEKELKLISIVK